MKQITEILTREERVKIISVNFSNGQFDFSDRSKPRAGKHLPEFKESTKHKQKQKGCGACFDLDLPPNVSAMNNDILRSGLFSSARRSEPSDDTLVHDLQIATVGKTKISLTGYVLDQVDYQVYECLINQFKLGGIELEMRLVDLAKMIRWEKGGNQTESLIMSLKKLNSSSIEIDTPEYRYFGGLVDRAVYEKYSGTVNVKLGAEVAKMYASNNWTMLSLDESSSLGRNYLARWMYKFFKSHKSPFPYKLETIKELSNNAHIQQKGFNIKLKKACALLNEKLGWEFSIDKRKLHIKKHELVETNEDSEMV